MNNENETANYTYYDSHSGTYSSYSVDESGRVSNETNSIINLNTNNEICSRHDNLSVTQKMLDEIDAYPSSALLEVLRKREIANAKEANCRWWEKYTGK